GRQQFTDRFLRAVGGGRREMEFVADDVRKRPAKSRAGGRKDQFRVISGAGTADRIEQRPHAVEIATIAFVEIELGLRRHDTCSVKDHVRPAGDKLFGNAGRCEVLRYNVYCGGSSRRRGGGEYIRQRKLLDGTA